MHISKITLSDYRIYNGVQEVCFRKDDIQNVYIISGNNGFGKTTLLNSLVWCLYGKQMVDVDDKFKTEIYEVGGYRKYASSNLNKLAQEEGKDSYSVTIDISDISIPSLICNSLQVIRSFNTTKQSERIEILIDGMENELTREVGQEIFISDFILPKEIAKFFFFDAEKIVALAEIKSISDKRKLSKAYSEVLGIKKYEDLKTNLEDLRVRLRKDSPTNKERTKYKELLKEVTNAKDLITEYGDQVQDLLEEKDIKKKKSEQYQEKLIREGNSLTVDGLKKMRKDKDQLAKEYIEVKSQFKSLLDLAPFALAGKLFEQSRNQILKESENKTGAFNAAIIKAKAKKIKADLIKQTKQLNLPLVTQKELATFVENRTIKHFSKSNDNHENAVLLDFTDEEKQEVEAVYNNLRFSYSLSIKEITKKYKRNRNSYNKIIRELADAETKENDLLIKEIRQQKTQVDNQIDEIDAKVLKLNVDVGVLQKELIRKTAILSALGKKIEVYEVDKEKDKTAERLVKELETFIYRLKEEKKSSLEDRIKTTLNELMHKKGFVNNVEVEIIEDLIDIKLFDNNGKEIEKETLSKGEQQLYATALLKSLVDESNIEFPVFIDSPLQKFDTQHAKNIIAEFYPGISDQVVLFPLVEKELTKPEYDLLLPRVKATYLINNKKEYSSEIVEVKVDKLFQETKRIYERV